MKKIFEPSAIGTMVLKNRLIRSATWENMTTPDGHMTEQLYALYETLAASEVGMIITGYANIVAEEQPNPGMMGIYDDSFIEEYQKLTQLVHQQGSKIVMQLAYGGTKTTYKVGERVIFAPSEVPERSTKVAGKAMTKEEIQYIIGAFGKAAARAKAAGFDGVELHGAHTYLINQFLSPYYNRRTDEYGGSLTNRMRFLMEIYEEVRSRVGEDFPILVKLTCSEFFEGGLDFTEAMAICKAVAQKGADAIELTGNIHGKANKMTGEVYDNHQIAKEGYFLDYAKEAAEALAIPVIAVGGFRTLEMIEQVIGETAIDYVALSRPLLAEPSLIRRWKAGDRKKAKCVSCSRCRTAEGNYCVVFK